MIKGICAAGNIGTHIIDPSVIVLNRPGIREHDRQCVAWLGYPTNRDSKTDIF